MFRTATQSVLLARASSSAHRGSIGRSTSNAIARPTKLIAQCIFLTGSAGAVLAQPMLLRRTVGGYNLPPLPRRV